MSTPTEALRAIADMTPTPGREAESLALVIAAARTQVDKLHDDAWFVCPHATPHLIEMSYPVWIPEGIEDRYAWMVDFEAQPWKQPGGCWCSACDDHVIPVRIRE